MNKKIIFIIGLILVILIGVLMMNSKENTKVKLETSQGEIVIELNSQEAPITVSNFLRYVEEGHYDGTIFHRVIDGFMIQGGGYTPDGQEKSTHEPIKLESNNGLKNEIYTIAMARTMVEDSATSQFFINSATTNDFLNYAPENPGYAVFGKVVQGMDVVDKIAKVETNSQDKPLEDVVIVKASVV